LKRILLLLLIPILLSSCTQKNNKVIETEAVISENVELKETLINVEEEKSLLEREYETIVNEHKDLTEQLRNKVEMINELNNTVEDLENREHELTDQIQDKNKKLNNLQEEIWKLQSRFENEVKNKHYGSLIENNSTTEFNPFFVGYGLNWEKEESEFSNQVYFIGGSHDKKWFGLEDFVLSDHGDLNIALFNENDTYDVYSFNGYLNAETIKYPSYREYNALDPVEYQFRAPLANNYDESIVVGIKCNWDPQPRLPKVSEDKSVVWIDVDGDGVDEIIEKEASEDYEVLWFLDDNGKTPNFRSTYFKWYGVVFIDLNGDNKLEMVKAYTGSTGFGLIVFDFIEGQYEWVVSYQISD